MLRHSRRSTRASASSRHRGVLSLPQTSSRALPRGLRSRSRGRTVRDGGHGRRQAAGGWRAASGARGRGCGDGGGRWSCQSRRDAGAGGANQRRRPRGACRPQLRRRAAIGRRQWWEVLLRVGRRLGRRRCPWCVDAGASGGSWDGHTSGGGRCGCGCGGYGTLAATKRRPRRSCGNTGTWEGYVSEPVRWPRNHKHPQLTATQPQPQKPQPQKPQPQQRTLVVATALCDLSFRCLLSGLHIIPQVQLAPPLLHLAIPRALAARHRLRWGHRVCVEA